MLPLTRRGLSVGWEGGNAQQEAKEVSVELASVGGPSFTAYNFERY